MRQTVCWFTRGWLTLVAAYHAYLIARIFIISGAMLGQLVTTAFLSIPLFWFVELAVWAPGIAAFLWLLLRPDTERNLHINP